MRDSLSRDEKGASAIEFALAAPAMLMFIIGIAQLGMLCMADAGLRSAVAEGARAAALYYPTPVDDATILARIDDAAWGMQEARIAEPEIERGFDDDGCEYIEIAMSYSAPLNFAFLELSPVTLTETRRVYVQGGEPCSIGSDDETGGSTGSTTSAGGTTSTGGDGSTSSASSTGGDGSTGSTSSTSTGSTSTGSTSSTSTSSTSTTSSTGSSSSSSNGSSSNGSSSNGSSGHDHGNGNGNGSSGNSNGNGNGH